MRSVKKAVIPAAGFGTRVLPATKTLPKEMLPIIDRPSIHYIVEEAVAAGCDEILIITSRGKGAMEDYFDRAPELEAVLERSGKTDALKSVLAPTKLANIHYVRQQEQRGLGDAIYCAKEFVGNDPFIVLYADDVILGDKPAALELVEAYEKFGLPACAVNEVLPEELYRYSSMKIKETLSEQCFSICDMVEKPKTAAQAFSNFSILGRVLLDQRIFQILEHTKAGAGGEIQLTDAMAELSRTVGMTGVKFSGTRFDMGSKAGILKANIKMGLKNPEIKEEIARYIKEIAGEL